MPAATDKNGGGGGAVACCVIGLGSYFLDHLGAHVLELVLELDLLSYGYAILGDGRRAIGLVKDYVAALGSKSYLDCVSKNVDTLKHLDTGIISEKYFLCTHLN